MSKRSSAETVKIHLVVGRVDHEGSDSKTWHVTQYDTIEVLAIDLHV